MPSRVGEILRYCTVSELYAPPRRYHDLRLFFVMAKAWPISRDKMFGDVVPGLERIVLW